MDYLELLTQKEKETLCQIIGGKEFKELFKSNEKQFAKIQKGFRAKTLPEERALSIAAGNTNRPFIASYLNIRVQHWVKEIQDNIEQLEGEGASHRTALATTMLDSVFVEHIDLYFKLTGDPLDSTDCESFYQRMEEIKAERKRRTEVADRLADMEEQNRQLSEQIQAARDHLDETKAEYERRLQEMEGEKEKLSSQLAEAEAKMQELQIAPTAFKSHDEAELAKYDDRDHSVLPTTDTDEFVSLCKVITGKNWLIRYADLNRQGQYEVFQRNESLPSYFENRDIIFYKDSPVNEDIYSVWNWSAVPNMSDPSKDYVKSQYNKNIAVIEIVFIEEAASLDDLIGRLKNGIPYQPHSRRYMFSFCESEGQYVGILCNKKSCSISNGRAAFSDDCLKVPVYKFSEQDVIRLSNGFTFYRNAFAGTPLEVYHLKNPLDAVKTIVLSAISWKTYKAKSIINSQYNTFKEFLNGIPTDDVLNQIQKACHCSRPAAQKLLDEFLSEAWKYVDGKSLEDEIILSAISANIDLQEKTKALIRTDWEAENQGLLQEAHDKLNALDSELKSATQNLAHAQDHLDAIKAKEKSLAQEMAEKEKLAAEVEAAVDERIRKAEEKAADFIAEMAFVNGKRLQSQAAETSPPLEPSSYLVCPEKEEKADLEEHHSWQEIFNTLALELCEAGVAEQYRNGLAAFLCAAYLEKQPIFLIGPNAIEIAEAFSASVDAGRHGLLCCEGDYSRQAVSSIGAKGEKIVVIHNLLASSWMNRLPEMLSKTDIFFMATHPYSEDIQVEPKSLYGFMLPLFTEFFVNEKAAGNYEGGYFSSQFTEYTPPKTSRKRVAGLSKFSLGALVQNRIARIAAVMEDIAPSATADDEFLFTVFPIAYATASLDKLAEELDDPQNGINISADLKRSLRRVLGEAQ